MSRCSVVAAAAVAGLASPAVGYATPELVSRQDAADGGAPADAGGDRPSVSADGRLVRSSSGATHLTDQATDDPVNPHPLRYAVFLRDRAAGRTPLLSEPGTPASSYDASISSDGTAVAFVVRGDDPLAPGDM